ncbi:MAG: excinuclease ABC subunit A [Gammaproteobacteria bacterium]|nr:excinuclease ABC subunit A [Gammaproteobacteria bacterium]
MQNISIKGAKTHNLKNLNLELPRNQLIIFTGLSGSGKSSLAFDTIYAEGQRRYVESLSAYARQFLSMMEKPDVDLIEGLSPAISIEQKTNSHNPRSTVGTVTEIYDYLRLLYARAGIPKCPKHKRNLGVQNISEMVDQILKNEKGSKLMVLAPLINDRKGEHLELLKKIKSKGFIRVRINQKVYSIDQLPKLNAKKKHTIEVVVDRFSVKPDISLRLTESFETALDLAQGVIKVIHLEKNASEYLFSDKYACPICGYSIQELEPRTFSFNNPAGACETCEGLGVEQFFSPHLVIKNSNLSIAEGAIRGWDRRNFYYFHLIKRLSKHFNFDIEMPFESHSESTKNILLYGSGNEKIQFYYPGRKGRKISRKHVFEGVIPNLERRYKETDSQTVKDALSKFMSVKTCKTCHGTRLNEGARNVFIQKKNIAHITQMNIDEALDFFKQLKIRGTRGEIASNIVKEIYERLLFLSNVGLSYLNLKRSAETLSGGESQRIRLASQIGSGLVGVMYILDEPTIGLHQRDNKRLISTLTRLRDLGNTVIIVEHDEDAIRSGDYIVDLGPGAGKDGGNIVSHGSIESLENSKHSLTGQYLNGQKSIAVPIKRQLVEKDKLIKINNARKNNLKGLNVEIPLGLLTCVTGVSGSGKSSLINGTLNPMLIAKLQKRPSEYLSDTTIDGTKYLRRIINISQSPIGRTPRSNPATYTGLFTATRELFAATEESRSRGYKPGRFSFNVKGGRCETCKGGGVIKVEMNFLADIYVTCDACKGMRFNRETLEISYKGKNIYDILEMTVDEAYSFFINIPSIKNKLNTLLEVGLGYIKLGQNAVTLSGGEAQRIKLSKELSKRGNSNTLYLLDEPTTGLHFHDINQLLKVLLKLRDDGNTIVVIEHNLDVIKTADWIIDLGPEGGDKGGEIIAVGSPETISKCKSSHTGKYLKKVL